MIEGPRQLILRADAGVQMGTGHVMRCLALAQAWQASGGHACIAMAVGTPAVERRIESERLTVEHLTACPGSADDAQQTANLAWRSDAACVVLDGYHFDAEYQRIVKAAGLALVCIDDCGHAETQWADLVLNQNPYAHEGLYPNREAYTRLLLGTRYALLRREFWAWRGWTRRVPPTARRLLITLGGYDADNVTLKALQALALIGDLDLEVRVVVGGGNPHLATLQRCLETLRLPSESLMVDVQNMPELMAWADLAVSSAGTTCLELAFLQLPAMLLILAENQRGNAQAMAAAGAALNLGWHEEVSGDMLAAELRRLALDDDLRREMALRSATLVDGDGGVRAVDAVRGVGVRVRRATHDDCVRLFEWANDPLTRAMSFRSRPIAWEEHRQWFERVVDDPSVMLWIAEGCTAGGCAPVGQVRIDADGSVSISVARESRGHRLARPALQAALGAWRAQFPEKKLVAFIKPENSASQRVFAQVGFRPIGPTLVKGHACLQYEYPA